MQKHFKIFTSMGMVLVQGDNATEALANLIKAEPSAIVLGERAAIEITATEAAVWEIKGIACEIAIMGANDYEFSAIEEILNRMNAGVLTPGQAVKQAYAIMCAKQDYH